MAAEKNTTPPELLQQLRDLKSAVAKEDQDSNALQNDCNEAIIHEDGLSLDSARLIGIDANRLIADYFHTGTAALTLSTALIAFKYKLSSKLLNVIGKTTGAVAAAGLVFDGLAEGLEEVPDAAKYIDSKYPSIGNALFSLSSDISNVATGLQNIYSSFEAAYASISTGVTNVLDSLKVSGFDGDEVYLRVYCPEISQEDLIGSGSAVVKPGETTFPSFQDLPGATNLVEGSLTLSGDRIELLYPSDGGDFAGGEFNGYVLTDKAEHIVGATLTGTNIEGLTSDNISFGAHSVAVNVSNLSLPFGTDGFIDIQVSFSHKESSIPFLLHHVV